MVSHSNGFYTICYASGMAAAVAPGFLPFDATANPEAERRETAHMLDFWRRGLHRQHRVSGLLSPKFATKTGFDGKSFHDFVTGNPNYDVWFMNPFPHYRYLSYNLWEHGESWHPGLCERASKIFAAAGIAIDLDKFPRSKQSTLLFSNFWVGTAKFWDQFMPFVEHVALHAEQVSCIYDTFSYGNTNLSYFPFVFERLFTTFITMHPGIRARYIDFEFEHILQMTGSKTDNLLIREWGPMIDKWDRTGTYSDDQRVIFRGMQKLSNLALRDSDAWVATWSRSCAETSHLG